MMTTSIPAWFEIPTIDLDRARRFWGAVTQTELKSEAMGPMTMAIFPFTSPQSSGALVKMEGYKPSTDGSIIYLEVDDLRAALARANDAGGETLHPVTALPDDNGFFAQVRDSEGNRVGLFSKRDNRAS
ncbi:MAG TPA: VOC family protein [Nannocystis exedens]|nr:VOC family protein [Nannocystis exedens]